MGFDLALYLREPKSVRAIQRALPTAFGREGIARGYDVIESLAPYVSGGLRAPLLHLLLREGVLIRVKAAPSIQDYLFRLDDGKAQDFFSAQVAAAHIVREMEDRPAQEDEPIELVATLPAERIVGRRVDGIGSIDAAIRRLIVRSARHVVVVNPFFDSFGVASIEDALVGRARAGVSIRIVGRELGGAEKRPSPSLRPLVWLDERFRELELEDRLEVRDFAKRDPGTGRLTYALHSKIILSDEDACYIGSANITETGLRMNFELGVVLHGSRVDPIRKLIRHLWRASTPVTLTNALEIRTED